MSQTSLPTFKPRTSEPGPLYTHCEFNFTVRSEYYGGYSTGIIDTGRELKMCNESKQVGFFRGSRTTLTRFAARLVCVWGFCCLQPEKGCQKLPQIELGAFLLIAKGRLYTSRIALDLLSTQAKCRARFRSTSTSSTVGECHTPNGPLRAIVVRWNAPDSSSLK
jgi:hypothetical protein